MVELVQELQEADTKTGLKEQRFYLGKCLWRNGDDAKKRWESQQTPMQVTTAVKKRKNELDGSDLDAGQSKECLARLSESPQAKIAIRGVLCLPGLGLPLSPLCAQSWTRSSQQEVCPHAKAATGFRTEHLGPMVSYASCSWKTAWRILRTTNIFLNTTLYCPLA